MGICDAGSRPPVRIDHAAGIRSHAESPLFWPHNAETFHRTSCAGSLGWHVRRACAQCIVRDPDVCLRSGEVLSKRALPIQDGLFIGGGCRSVFTLSESDAIERSATEPSANQAGWRRRIVALDQCWCGGLGNRVHVDLDMTNSAN